MDDASLKEWMDVQEGRYSGYAFLSRVYRAELSTEFLSTLAANTATVAAAEGDDGTDRLVAFAQRLKDANLQNATTELAAEFAGLFLNGSDRPVFPYESVYTSPQKLVMQKARDEVLAEYRREGLDRATAFNEPEDHIALELEFMAYLCRQATAAMEAGDRVASKAYLDKQRGFIEKHLGIWVPRFCKDLQKNAKSDFYKSIAQLTLSLIDQDKEMIGALVERIETLA